MPDNATFYQWAYGLTLVLYLAYTVSILLRRREVARRRAALRR